MRRLFLEPIFLFLLIMGSFLFRMGTAPLQPTADLWIERSVGFMTAFTHRDWGGTYQQYHPGVTVMWCVAAGSWLFYHLSPFLGFFDTPDILSVEVLPRYLLFALFPLYLALAGLYVLSWALIARLVSRYVAWLWILLMASEPFILANSRSLHLDAMVSLSLWVSLLFLLLFRVDSLRVHWFLSAGVAAGFALLTKVSTVILGPLAALFFISAPASWVDRIRWVTLYGVNMVFVFFLFFPAMWVAPYETLVERVIGEGIFETGVQEISRPLFVHSEGVGALYHLIAYPVTALYRLSPQLSVGLVLFVISLFWLRKDVRNRNLWYGIAVFACLYLGMITFSTKKIYRYVLPLFPLLCLCAAYGYTFLFDKVKGYSRHAYWAVLGVGIGVASWVYVSNVPYAFAYFNPLLGGSAGAARVVSLNQDAVGYDHVAAWLQQADPQGEAVVAAFDWKILRMLYAGRTESIRLAAKPLTADYLVLPFQRGEEYLTPEYQLVHTIEIANLPYWRLYERAR